MLEREVLQARRDTVSVVPSCSCLVLLPSDVTDSSDAYVAVYSGTLSTPSMVQGGLGLIAPQVGLLVPYQTHHRSVFIITPIITLQATTDVFLAF